MSVKMVLDQITRQPTLSHHYIAYAISAAVLVGSFVVGSQLVQPSMAQDLGQIGQQAKEKLSGTGG
jgi:hypothetical protein